MGHGLGNLQPWSSQQHSLQAVQWFLLLTWAAQSLLPQQLFTPGKLGEEP